MVSRIATYPNVRGADSIIPGQPLRENAAGKDMVDPRQPEWGWSGRNTTESYNNVPHKANKQQELYALRQLADGVQLDQQEAQRYVVEETLKDYKADADQLLQKEFMQWLQGVHPTLNEPGPHRQVQVMDIVGDGPNASQTLHNINNKVTLEHTNWKGDLTHLPGVRKFLEEEERKRHSHEMNVSKLMYFGPQNIEDAWKYFQLLSKQTPYQKPIGKDDPNNPGGQPPNPNLKVRNVWGWQVNVGDLVTGNDDSMIGEPLARPQQSLPPSTQSTQTRQPLPPSTQSTQTRQPLPPLPPLPPRTQGTQTQGVLANVTTPVVAAITQASSTLLGTPNIATPRQSIRVLTSNATYTSPV